MENQDDGWPELGDPGPVVAHLRAILQSLPEGEVRLRSAVRTIENGRVVYLRCPHCERTWDCRTRKGGRVGFTVAAADSHAQSCWQKKYDTELA